MNLAPQSPRVRGKPEKFAKGLLDHASTPACAGKTTISCSSSSLPALNPRVCGENPTASPCNADDVPQPPRVRGKLQILTPVAPGQASTPACAGKTGAQSARAVRFSLNPRVCGENTTPSPACWPSPLQSPRARGKHRQRYKSYVLQSPRVRGKLFHTFHTYFDPFYAIFLHKMDNFSRPSSTGERGSAAGSQRLAANSVEVEPERECAIVMLRSIDKSCIRCKIVAYEG